MTERFDRALEILMLMGAGRVVAAPELARRFGVSIRTIYRDMDALTAAGVPLQTMRGAGGGYRLEDGFFLPPVAFRREEAVALILCMALARSLRVTPLAADLDAAAAKLVAALPQRLRPLLGEARRMIGFERTADDIFHPEPPSPAAADERQAVDAALTAILDRTQIAFTYHSPYSGIGRPVEADPLGVLWDRDHWYVVGLKRDDGGTRTVGRRLWRADRMGAVRRLTLPAERPGGFDVRTLLDRAWLADAMRDWARKSPVRVRISRRQADLLKRDWQLRHATFEPDGPDGIILAYGENDRANAFALIRWLGGDAELLEPAEWRQAFAAELAAMAARHA
jgi:predicted DNA-binding transcriptional regulator YafY